MRELTKSMLSYGWAMSVFGVQQTMDALAPNQGCNSVKAMQDVTNAAVSALNPCMKAAFTAGDNLQGGMVDMVFGMMGGGLDMNRWMRMGNDMMQQMGKAGTRAAETAAGAAANATGTGSDAGASSTFGWGPPR
jgi:hypothetical protein